MFYKRYVSTNCLVLLHMFLLQCLLFTDIPQAFYWTWCWERMLELFCFDAQVQSRSAGDWCFTHNWAIKKITLNIPFFTAIIIIVTFFNVRIIYNLSLARCWLWPRAYFLLFQSRCVYYKCRILLTSYFNKYFMLLCMPGSAVHLL